MRQMSQTRPDIVRFGQTSPDLAVQLSRLSRYCWWFRLPTQFTSYLPPLAEKWMGEGANLFYPILSPFCRCVKAPIMMLSLSRTFLPLAVVLALPVGHVLAQQVPGLAVPVPPASVGQSTGQLAPTFVQADAASVAQANMRIERLEGELRQMTGQMEQLMFQMTQLRNELTRAREDTEFRLRELEGGGVAPGTAPSPAPTTTQGIAPQTLQNGVQTAANVSDEDLRQALLAREQTVTQGAAPADLGTLSMDANGVPVGGTVGTVVGDTNGPLDLSSLTQNGDPAVRPQTPLGNQVAALDPLGSLAPGDVYELGYDHVLRGDYAQAVLTFEDFLARYDTDPLRPNAHFWLGESMFALGEYTPAAEQFLTVFNSYPEDVKVPDALLKLAMSLSRLGASEQACATFGKLMADYPRAPQIVLDTARTEQSLAGC